MQRVCCNFSPTLSVPCIHVSVIEAKVVAVMSYRVQQEVIRRGAQTIRLGLTGGERLLNSHQSTELSSDHHQFWDASNAQQATLDFFTAPQHPIINRGLITN